MLAAALAIPVSGAAMVGLTGPAYAGSKPPKVTIECTTITGNAATTVTVSGCTGGNTGGGSEPVDATELATGGTITWLSGATNTIGAPTLTSTSAKHCPGYVKGASSEPSAEKFDATVTGGTGGNPVSGSAKGAVCIASNGDITALKPLKAKGPS
jgi:hypothetical protein